MQAKQLAVGIILIGLVTAFGLHAVNLPPLIKNTGSGLSSVLRAAEIG
jgi:hypothetical protein